MDWTRRMVFEHSDTRGSKPGSYCLFHPWSVGIKPSNLYQTAGQLVLVQCARHAQTSDALFSVSILFAIVLSAVSQINAGIGFRHCKTCELQECAEPLRASSRMDGSLPSRTGTNRLKVIARLGHVNRRHGGDSGCRIDSPTENKANWRDNFGRPK